jgi:hypothetical protein
LFLGANVIPHLEGFDEFEDGRPLTMDVVPKSTTILFDGPTCLASGDVMGKRHPEDDIGIIHHEIQFIDGIPKHRDLRPCQISAFLDFGGCHRHCRWRSHDGLIHST